MPKNRFLDQYDSEDDESVVSFYRCRQHWDLCVTCMMWDGNRLIVLEYKQIKLTEISFILLTE